MHGRDIPAKDCCAGKVVVHDAAIPAGTEGILEIGSGRLTKPWGRLIMRFKKTEKK